MTDCNFTDCYYGNPNIIQDLIICDHYSKNGQACPGYHLCEHYSPMTNRTDLCTLATENHTRIETYDSVSRPSHYTEGRKYEPKDVIRDWGLNFNLGNTIKYVARAGRKDDILQDLKKARQYLDFEIEYLEQEAHAHDT